MFRAALVLLIRAGAVSGCGLCPALRVITAPLNYSGAAGRSHSSGGSVAEDDEVSHYSDVDEPSQTRDGVCDTCTWSAKGL